MNIQSFAGKNIRITCVDGQVYEGVAELYYDEDETMQQYLWLRHPHKNVIVQFGVADIKNIVVLNN